MHHNRQQPKNGATHSRNNNGNHPHRPHGTTTTTTSVTTTRTTIRGNPFLLNSTTHHQQQQQQQQRDVPLSTTNKPKYLVRRVGDVSPLESRLNNVFFAPISQRQTPINNNNNHVTKNNTIRNPHHQSQQHHHQQQISNNMPPKKRNLANDDEKHLIAEEQSQHQTKHHKPNQHGTDKKSRQLVQINATSPLTNDDDNDIKSSNDVRQSPPSQSEEGSLLGFSFPIFKISEFFSTIAGGSDESKQQQQQSTTPTTKIANIARSLLSSPESNKNKNEDAKNKTTTNNTTTTNTTSTTAETKKPTQQPIRRAQKKNVRSPCQISSLGAMTISNSMHPIQPVFDDGFEKYLDTCCDILLYKQPETPVQHQQQQQQQQQQQNKQKEEDIKLKAPVSSKSTQSTTLSPPQCNLLDLDPALLKPLIRPTTPNNNNNNTNNKSNTGRTTATRSKARDKSRTRSSDSLLKAPDHAQFNNTLSNVKSILSQKSPRMPKHPILVQQQQQLLLQQQKQQQQHSTDGTTQPQTTTTQKDIDEMNDLPPTSPNTILRRDAIYDKFLTLLSTHNDDGGTIAHNAMNDPAKKYIPKYYYNKFHSPSGSMQSSLISVAGSYIQPTTSYSEVHVESHYGGLSILNPSLSRRGLLNVNNKKTMKSIINDNEVDNDEQHQQQHDNEDDINDDDNDTHANNKPIPATNNIKQYSKYTPGNGTILHPLAVELSRAHTSTEFKVKQQKIQNDPLYLQSVQQQEQIMKTKAQMHNALGPWWIKGDDIISSKLTGQQRIARIEHKQQQSRNKRPNYATLTISLNDDQNSNFIQEMKQSATLFSRIEQLNAQPSPSSSSSSSSFSSPSSSIKTTKSRLVSNTTKQHQSNKKRITRVDDDAKENTTGKSSQNSTSDSTQTDDMQDDDDVENQPTVNKTRRSVRRIPTNTTKKTTTTSSTKNTNNNKSVGSSITRSGRRRSNRLTIT